MGGRRAAQCQRSNRVSSREALNRSQRLPVARETNGAEVSEDVTDEVTNRATAE